jgi:hypothetical protein
MKRCGGSKREACRVLGISYHTLNAYLEYPIDGAGRLTGAGAELDCGETLPGISGECGERDGAEGSL